MNIGGYDDSSFSESDGNRILGEILEAKKLIKVHFAEGDKTPNFDGCFILCEKDMTKQIPIGRFNVQIKTVSKNYTNNNRNTNTSDYKYSCETKIFNSVKKGISCDPTILFLVDIVHNKVFYIHVSPEYVLRLKLRDEASKVIYFNESDRLDKETFYDHFSKIYAKHRQLVFSEVESTITVSEDLDSETVAMLQDIIDNFNNVFSNELSFIKNHSYPNVWKFGIAYIKHNDVSATIGIYKVLKGENGSLIRKFTKEDSENCETVSYFKLSHKSTKEIIDDVMFRIIDNYFDKSYINPKYLPQNILEEIAFYFLDSIARYCEQFARKNQFGVFCKDKVSTLEVNEFWCALIEYSLEITSYYKLSSSDQRVGAPKVDPIGTLHSGNNHIDRQKLFESIIQNPTGQRPNRMGLIFEGEFSYCLVQKVIQELINRNTQYVNRVWEPQNLEKHFEELDQLNISGLNRHETGYTLADFSQNLHKIFVELPSSYSHTNQSLLGKYSETIKVCNKYVIYVESTNKASCIQVELPSAEFRISQPADIIGIDKSEDVFDSMKKLYPHCVSIAQTSLCDTFSKPYPLYQNVSHLIKKSVYRYFNREMPYSHSFVPLIR